jgi:acyl-CoA synthetase (AMP-forming)/AMP-acid ligase II
MPYASTILELLERGRPEAVAIGAPGRPPLTFAGLRAQTGRVVAALNERGIGRNDPVGIVLSNGPEMAAAFVSVASAATTAPLNPAYRTEEFEFYLSDLGARLLIVEAGADTPARAAAARLGAAVVEVVVPPGAPAGVFELAGDTGGRARQPGPAEPDDVALVLHTSGTTARPKIVPLSHRNVCASADHVAASLALTADDRCLNIMPLFHIHGLVAAVLGSFAAGASVWCTPGFNALSFFAWMKEVHPTWYTAVPTMHQAILGRATRNLEVIEQGQIRLVRSSSASLPPQVMSKLEETFGVPVIEAYGMTEAAHQMASNPLPPRPRAPGSVGVAAGPEIAILDDQGRRLSAGATGEVAIRGPNVTSGYQNNPAANATAFTEGWFRTGDQGVMDDSGYLRLTGRLKEIINRGGEKISPREIDEVRSRSPCHTSGWAKRLPRRWY